MHKDYFENVHRMSQKHIYWKNGADAKFVNIITFISPSIYVTTFSKNV